MIVFSDVDGTLLDRDTYSHAQAAPAIAQLRAHGIPLVLVTSKCRAEVEVLRLAIGNTDPYIVENGAAAIIPNGPTLVFGSTAAAARSALRTASATAAVRVRGFSEMSIDEICERSNLPPAAAALASHREYGEPFVLLDGSAEALADALAAQGFQMTRGGRFYHVLGGCDKARAVTALAERIEDDNTAGLGDAPNDAGFLAAVRWPILMPSPHLDAMRQLLPSARIAPAPGPAGWNLAVLDLLAGFRD
jgi:mannosyl-3-phosphoglycerate phosphatase family protein